MILAFAPIKIRPEHWGPPGWREKPFSATYGSTLALLDRELDKLGATAVQLQVDTSDANVRLDGQLKASAVVNHPGVILTIETRKHGTLVYETDMYAPWQQNLRAIALGLEALRKVDRYGIARRGQQYAGYRELPAGMPLDAGLTVEEAARLIAEHCGDSTNWLDKVAADPFLALDLFKAAAFHCHPDVGGDPDLFRRLTEARDLLKAAS